MNASKMETMDVKVSRLISASPVEVYDAWLDPKHPGSQFQMAARVKVEPKVDGFFYWMHPSGECESTEGEKCDYELAHYGRFLVMEKGRRLKYTWVSQHTRGLESVVEVEFVGKGDQTQLSLTHSGLPADEFGQAHDGGWNHIVNTLMGTFEKVKA